MYIQLPWICKSRKDIGARLRRTRQALGLRSSDICAELGIRRSTWSMDEAGKALPNVHDMVRFAERYGVTLDWIYRGRLSGVDYDLAKKLVAWRTPPAGYPARSRSPHL